ncbi:hypothetical protein ACFQ1M_13040 [Sungkyunkwania multivorans]|uniref:Lipoprotein n=1 Tax=Sungkyunkwania multivorans TaxID=1173618 RepID=A0ABW3D1X4_9FLAO
MKRIVFTAVALTISLASCKTEKSDKENQVVEPVVVEKKIEDSKFPKIENSFANMKTIFSDSFEFIEGIGLTEIGVVANEGGKYQLIYFLEDKSDFDRIQELNVAFRVYPKSQDGKDANASTIASKCEVQQLENTFVTISNEFTVDQKEFEKVKVYFYHPKDGVQGRMMTILDVKF